MMTVGIYDIDEKRTKELGIPELLVVSNMGNKNHFFCIFTPQKTNHICPRCGNIVTRNQGNVCREYLDAFRRNGDAALITITLEFQKRKCESPGCGCVYYPEFCFARPYARTTRRLENAIVRLILWGSSNAEVANELEGRLTRQAVWRIFHQRVKELDADSSDEAAWFRDLLENDRFIPYPLLLLENIVDKGYLERLLNMPSKQKSTDQLSH